MRLHGRTPNDLFRAAALAFADATTEGARVEPRETREVTLEASSLDLLLVDFLDEILYVFDVQQFLLVDAEVQVERSAACRLHAMLSGETFDSSRHRITLLVKAVTYHALEVREDEQGWHATVVFDI